MSLDGIRAVSSYQSTQAVAASAPTPSVSAAAAVKAASVSDTVAVKKKAVYEGEEGSAYSQGEGTQKKPVSTADLQKTVDRLNVEMNKTECRYSLHEATNRVMISIVDKDTKEVIKEFPVEEALDRISKALELAGLIVDEKL